jgi:shikimate kinase
MNLILCGLPASGKTYWGKLTAESLQWPFIDTDQELERMYLEQTHCSLTCREIFLQLGKEYFRASEKKVVALLAAKRRSVIALGGGTLSSEENRQLLKKLGKLVYLKCEPALIWERLSAQPHWPSYLNPQCPQASFEEMVQARLPLYEECCDTIIEPHKLAANTVVSYLCQCVLSGELEHNG